MGNTADESEDICLDSSLRQDAAIESDSDSDPHLNTGAARGARWSGQLKGVLKKNFRLYTRKKSLWASVVILPLVFMILAYLYTGLLMAVEKPSEAYRDPITNYPTVAFPGFSSTKAAALCAQEQTPCLLAVSPDDTKTRALAAAVRDNLLDSKTGRMPPLVFYENGTALREAVNADSGRFFAGIAFNGGEFADYTLYMKSSLLPQDGYESMPNIYSGEIGVVSNASMCITSGLATLQSALDLAVLNTQQSFDVALSSKILPGWESNPAAPTLALFICIMALISYFPLLTNGASLITNENLSKTRQYLLTLGLKRWVYWLSWLLTLFVPSMVISVLWIVCCMASATLSASGALYMLFYYALFSVSIIMVIFVVQCLVKSVMWSTAIASAFLILPPVIGSLLPSIKWAQCIVSFFSSYTLYLAISNTTASKMYGISASMLNSAEVFVYAAVDSVLYAAIAWYLNEVFTGDYGVPKSPLFPFDKAYWKALFGLSGDVPPQETDFPEPREASKSKALAAADENFERAGERASRRAGIALCGLTKEFENGSIVAVDSASGSFRRGEITCLLGQNGAGKTTLISALYGLIKPSAGTAFVDGQDIATDIDRIRSSIGVCPQDDILYSELNAQDHVDLVMALKGVLRTDESGEYVQRLMDELALFEGAKPEDPVSAYSGGMKRKLSLVLSLIGDSRVIFLDEPTSGVDPVSKRAIWDVLSRAKEGRTVILTTHSMEEAESLSDYIYIMVSGKFRCGGSPMFLKQKFGVGYYLSVTKKRGCDVPALHRTVEGFIPGAAIEKDVNDTVSFRLPFSDVPKFSQLFERLESAQDELGIDGFGLSLSTIEDVFVRTCSEADPLPAEARNGSDSATHDSHSGSSSNQSDTESDVSDDSDDADEKNLLLEEQTTLEDKLANSWKGKEFKRASFWRQFLALTKFKLVFYKRNPSHLWSIISVPLLNMLLTLIVLRFVVDFINSGTSAASFHSALEYAPTHIPYTWSSSEVYKGDVNMFVQRVNEAAPDRLRMEYVSDENEIKRMALEDKNVSFALLFNKFALENGTADITVMYDQKESNTPIDIVDLVYSGLRAVASNTTGNISGLWVQKVLGDSSTMSGTMMDFVEGIVSAFVILTIYILVSMRTLETPIRDRECGIKAQLYISCLRPAVYVLSSLFVAALALVPSYVITEILMACFGIKLFTDPAAAFVMFIGSVLFIIALASLNHCYSNMFKNSITASSKLYMCLLCVFIMYVYYSFIYYICVYYSFIYILYI